MLRVLSHAKKENRCDTHPRKHVGKHAQIRKWVHGRMATSPEVLTTAPGYFLRQQQQKTPARLLFRSRLDGGMHPVSVLCIPRVLPTGTTTMSLGSAIGT